MDQGLHVFIIKFKAEVQYKDESQTKAPQETRSSAFKAWRREYCLSENSASNLIPQRFLQKGNQQDVRKMWSMWVSTQNFYHGHILQDLSHQLFVTGGQLCIFQELPIMYLPWFIVGKIVYFLLPFKLSHHLLPNIPMECPEMIGFLRLWEKLLCDPCLLFTKRHQSQLT